MSRRAGIWPIVEPLETQWFTARVACRRGGMRPFDFVISCSEDHCKQIVTHVPRPKSGRPQVKQGGLKELGKVAV
jgi:hypothetical protein